MSCQDRVIDCFVTKDYSDETNNFDDELIGPFWSVVPEDVGDPAVRTATVVNVASEWVAPCTLSPLEELDVGDLVRLGNVSTSGYTDYMTIMEKMTVTSIRNGTVTTEQGQSSDNPALKLRRADDKAFDGTPMVAATTAADGTATNAAHAGTYSLVCYRLNFALDATTPPQSYTRQGQAEYARMKAALEARDTYRVDPFAAIDGKAANLLYPLYRCKRWLTHTGDVQCKLDHGVKALHWIKLIGYSVFNKRQVGFAHGHEQIADDWIALQIKEVEGGVVSNNQTANGSFAILHCGGTKDNDSGAIEYHAHDPQGLFVHYFQNHNSTIRNLNLKFLDRLGEAAHFGRIHLWFKLCVQHG